MKLGSNNYEDLKQFSVCIEEKLFRMSSVRDKSLTYKTEEVQLTAVDEVFIEQDKTGKVLNQQCRVRVFFLSFLSGERSMIIFVQHLRGFLGQFFHLNICFLSTLRQMPQTITNIPRFLRRF